MSSGRFYVCGLGDIYVDDVEFTYRRDLMNRIAEFDNDFYLANQGKRVIARFSDGTSVVIEERVPIRDYVDCEILFAEEKNEKPKIKIRSRSAEIINYGEAEFPKEIELSASYKNEEVFIDTLECLLFTSEAVESILSKIEWDRETESNTVEQAGLLIGNRYKNQHGNVWGKVTHIIPLRKTQSSRRGIYMTSDSFYEASNCDFPKLKKDFPEAEIIGWYHTHTFSDQPVFSATDYQTQSTTFASHQSWFAVVLNAQQRTFSTYYNKNAVLIKSFFEVSDSILSEWNFGINEHYFGAEQKAKIKKGAYELEKEKAELEKLRKELEEREKKISKQLSTIAIQEQKIEREQRSIASEKNSIASERKNLVDERKRMDAKKRKDQAEMTKKESDLVKRERNLEVLQNLLKKIFPLAYEPNNGFRGLFSTGDIRERRIPSSISYSVGSSLDICFDSRSSSGQMRASVAYEMIQYGKVLNAIRNMVKTLTKTSTDFCALFDYIPPEQKFLVRSIVPTREISWNQNGNAILLALDTYNDVSVNRVIKELTENSLNVQLYVYIEETQTIFKKS